jgi:hypothetical protein
MKIDESDEQTENAYSAIDESLEPDSNVTVEREVQKEKQSLPSIATEEGRQICVRISPGSSFAPSRPRSRTSTRRPASETKFREKKHPEAPE